jgi:excisionase family DNA binding protein
MSSDEKHLSVSEVARELGISEALVRDLIGSGQLIAYRYRPRKTVIYREDLKKFKQSRRIEASDTREAG